MNGIQALALSKKYTNDYAEGLGASKGANCTIDSVTTSDDKATITFKWTSTDGTSERTTDVDVPLPVISENEDNTSEIYKLDIAIGGTTFTTKNMRPTHWFMGNELSGDEETIEKNIENAVLGDFYAIKDSGNLYKLTNIDSSTSTQTWTYQGNWTGDSAYNTWLKIDGNQGKSPSQFIESISGEGIVQQVVKEKPNIKLRSTQMNTWYYYQINDPDYADLDKFKQCGVFGNNMTIEPNTTLTIEAGTYKIKLPSSATYKINDVEYVATDTDGYVNITLDNDITIENTSEVNSLYLVLYCACANSDCLRNDNSFILQTKYNSDDEPNEILNTDCTFVESSNYDDFDVSNVYTFLSQLGSTTAWKYTTSKIVTELSAGNYALWDGTKYLIVSLTTAISSAILTKYELGCFAVFDENSYQAWIFGATSDNEYYLIGDIQGGHVATSDTLPEGVTELSLDLIQCGLWSQTIYVGESKADAGEVTLQTGSSSVSTSTKALVVQSATSPNTLTSSIGHEFYQISSNNDNPPDTLISSAHTHTFIYDVTFNNQKAIDYTNHNVWTRTKNNSTWSDWHINNIDFVKCSGTLNESVFSSNLTSDLYEGTKIVLESNDYYAGSSNLTININGSTYTVYNEKLSSYNLPYVLLHIGQNEYVVGSNNILYCMNDTSFTRIGSDMPIDSKITVSKTCSFVCDYLSSTSIRACNASNGEVWLGTVSLGAFGNWALQENEYYVTSSFDSSTNTLTLPLQVDLKVGDKLYVSSSSQSMSFSGVIVEINGVDYNLTHATLGTILPYYSVINGINEYIVTSITNPTLVNLNNNEFFASGSLMPNDSLSTTTHTHNFVCKYLSSSKIEAIDCINGLQWIGDVSTTFEDWICVNRNSFVTTAIMSNNVCTTAIDFEVKDGDVVSFNMSNAYYGLIKPTLVINSETYAIQFKEFSCNSTVGMPYVMIQNGWNNYQLDVANKIAYCNNKISFISVAGDTNMPYDNYINGSTKTHDFSCKYINGAYVEAIDNTNNYKWYGTINSTGITWKISSDLDLYCNVDSIVSNVIKLDLNTNVNVGQTIYVTNSSSAVNYSTIVVDVGTESYTLYENNTTSTLPYITCKGNATNKFVVQNNNIMYSQNTYSIVSGSILNICDDYVSSTKTHNFKIKYVDSYCIAQDMTNFNEWKGTFVMSSGVVTFTWYPMNKKFISSFTTSTVSSSQHDSGITCNIESGTILNIMSTFTSTSDDTNANQIVVGSHTYLVKDMYGNTAQLGYFVHTGINQYYFDGEDLISQTTFYID